MFKKRVKSWNFPPDSNLFQASEGDGPHAETRRQHGIEEDHVASCVAKFADPVLAEDSMEKLTRGQWWIATDSQQIDKNLGIRWKTDSPGFNFCPWGQVLEANVEENTEKHIFSLWMDRLLYPWLGIQLPILQFILVLSWYPIHSYIGWQAFGMAEDKLWG